jgi:hypothetical protein
VSVATPTMTPRCVACPLPVDLLSLEDIVLTRAGWSHQRCLTIKREDFCPVCGGPCQFPKQSIRPIDRINA